MSKRSMSPLIRGGALVLALATIAACDNGFRFPNDPSVALVCDKGYVLFIDTISGTGAQTGCVPKDTIVVHGFVTTSNGHPIEGVTVSVYPWIDEVPAGEEPDEDAVLPVQTNADGYFRFAGGNTTRDVIVHYSHPDYMPMTRNYDYYFDNDNEAVGYIAMDGSVDMEVMYAPVVAGHVYAGDAPAVGATVILYDAVAGSGVSLATTGANGDFSFADVWPGIFNVRVMPYDEDGDGVHDYRYTSIALGNIVTQTSLNLSNLIVALPAIQKQILYTNFLGFTPPVNPVTGTTNIIPGLRLFDPSASIIMHFGAETIPGTLDVSLRTYEPNGGYGDPMAITTSFANGDTVLTVDPAMDLTADNNSDTQYALRINTLLFADGSHFVRQTEATSWVEFRFDITDNAVFLTSPNDLALFFADQFNGIQRTTSIECDSFVCWLLDAAGSFYTGWADPENQAAVNAAFFNNASGFNLTWSHIPGAVNYNVYARRTSTSSTADNLSGWYDAGGTIASGPSDPNFDGTVYATGIMNTFWSTAFDTGLGTLGEGATVEIAVTALDQEGVESPLDPSAALTLSDVFPPFLDDVALNVNGAGIHAGSTEIGSSRLVKNTTLSFSEFMDTGIDPQIEFIGGNIVSVGAPETVSWDPAAGGTAQNHSQNAIVGPYEIAVRGACTPLECETVATENDIMCVRDAALLSASGEIFIIDNIAAPATGDIIEVVSVASGGIDTTNNLVTLNAPPANTLSGAAGNLACTSAPADGNNVTTLSMPATGTGTLQVANPEYFYVGQSALVYDTGTDSLATITVTAVRTGSNQIDEGGLAGFPTGSIVIPNWNGAAEYNFRAASTPTILDDTTGGATTTVEFVSLLASNVMIGDVCLVDLDGEVDTFGDRFFGSVTDVNMDVITPNHTLALGAPPAGMPAIPAGALVLQSVSEVTCLGDTLRVTGGPTDTSGNALGAFGDAASSCVGTFACGNFRGAGDLIH